MPKAVRVRAPVRVLDAGGWTDTWFSGGGVVCHLAVEEGVDATVKVRNPLARGVRTTELSVPAFRSRYSFSLEECPGRHPLLEAALRRWAPPDCHIEVTVRSFVPAGSGLGSSASVTVALISALHALSGEVLSPLSLAKAAHDIETKDVGLQSGIQDQIAAAYGGSNLIRIEQYPEAMIRPVVVPRTTWEDLTERLVTVYLGAPRRSSDVHEAVIAHLRGRGGLKLLDPLRAAASAAAEALVAGDLRAYGEAMIRNTDAQAALGAGIVSPLAEQVIELAGRRGVFGWKVNGAGGPGGTVSLIGSRDPEALTSAMASLPGVSVLELRPARSGAAIQPLD